MDYLTLKDMVGLTMSEIKVVDDEVVFVADTGDRFKFFHSQECCESVLVESVKGDLNNLKGSPLTRAEEKVKKWWGPWDEESCTETTYIFSTAKGTVKIRWYGSSNGYYSEDVDFDFRRSDHDSD